MAQIDAFFKLMNDEGASDVHMVARQQPVLRIRGDMERVKFRLLENDELKKMLYEICPEEKIKAFEECGDIDLATRFQDLPVTDAIFFSRNMASAPFFARSPLTSCPANSWD